MTASLAVARSGLAAFALATLAGLPATAQDAGQDGLLLDEVVLSASEDGEAGQSPQVSTIGAEELRRQQAGASVQTILGSLAGVSAATIAGDPSVAVNIRGLQGDGRVAVTIDGARQNFSREGHGINASFAADPEMLRSVEVVRGTGSAEAGAGAIGGTLRLRTVTAEDLIAPGETEGGEVRLRYGTLLAEPTVHAAWARQLDPATTALLAVTRSASDDYDAGDGTRVEAAEDTLSALAKLSRSFGEAQRLGFSASRLVSDYHTGVTEGYPRDTDLTTDNFVLDYGLGTGADPFSLTATLYRSASSVVQQLEDTETGAPVGAERSYDTVTDGVRAEGGGLVRTGVLDHDLAFALELFRDEVTTDDPDAGEGSLTASGEREIGSLHLEDAIRLTGSTEAVFGLRFDSYSLSSTDGGSDGTATSPSFTLRQKVGPALTLYATAARAYRPPTLSESLVNGQHPAPAVFYIRPNPDLEPESSLNREFGATLEMSGLITGGDRLRGQVAAYRNDIEDYIGLVRRGGVFYGYYQYDNIDRVRVEGLELELSYDAERVFASVSSQQIDGTDRSTNAPASGIPPDRTTLTLGLRGPQTGREAGLRVTRAAAREDGQLSTEAWQTLDLFFTIPLGPSATLGLALNNVTDETYTQYLNSQPSPGFNALASLTFTF